MCQLLATLGLANLARCMPLGVEEGVYTGVSVINLRRPTHMYPADTARGQLFGARAKCSIAGPCGLMPRLGQLPDPLSLRRWLELRNSSGRVARRQSCVMPSSHGSSRSRLR